MELALGVKFPFEKAVLLYTYWGIVLIGIVLNVVWRDLGMTEFQYMIFDVTMTVVMGVGGAAYAIITGKFHHIVTPQDGVPVISPWYMRSMYMGGVFYLGGLVPFFLS